MFSYAIMIKCLSTCILPLFLGALTEWSYAPKVHGGRGHRRSLSGNNLIACMLHERTALT